MRKIFLKDNGSVILIEGTIKVIPSNSTLVAENPTDLEWETIKNNINKQHELFKGKLRITPIKNSTIISDKKNQ